MLSIENDEIRKRCRTIPWKKAILTALSLLPCNSTAFSAHTHYGVARLPLNYALREKTSTLYHKQNSQCRRLRLSAAVEDDFVEHKDDEVVEKVRLREDPKFIEAVNEVKDAAIGIGESAKNLTAVVATNVPGILGRVVKRVVAEEMLGDIRRRRKHYKSDWTDALKKKSQTFSAILFLYFSCLAPAVSFGTIASQITNGSIGVVEFLLGSGCAGMAYSILCGQPMAFIAPTGLTLAFISGLFNFCTLKSIPFYPIYAWVGLWTSFFMITLGTRGASKTIKFCTRFTDEIFNALLSVNFIYEAVVSLRRNFILADPLNLSMPFVALSMAIGTVWTTTQAIAFQTSIYFNKRVRNTIKDFGPAFVIMAFSALNALRPIKKFGVPILAVPTTFELAGGRKFLVPLNTIPVSLRLLCALPAVLLTSLFFMDQNISVRVINNPSNHLKKGPAYNLDMVALGIITAVLSMFGLPWMCGATVQSLNHLRAMASYKLNTETNKIEIDEVLETRVTGFMAHALIALTVKGLSVLKYLPIPVVSGVFLYLGRKLMTGNTLFQRMKSAFAEKKLLPDDHPMHVLGRRKMNIFTVLQIICLGGLWIFKQNSTTSIFFPGVIGLLMFLRSFILPKFLTEKELVALGDPTP